MINGKPIADTSADGNMFLQLWEARFVKNPTEFNSFRTKCAYEFTSNSFKNVLKEAKNKPYDD